MNKPRYTVRKIDIKQTGRTFFGVGKLDTLGWQLLRANMGGSGIQMLYPDRRKAQDAASYLNCHSYLEGHPVTMQA